MAKMKKSKKTLDRTRTRAGGSSPGPKSIEQQEQQRGRPRALTDDELKSQRDSLFGIFGAHWAWIGWELSRAKTVGDVAQAFAALVDNCKNSSIALFFRHSPEVSETADLNDMRRQVSKAADQFWEARKKLEGELQQVRQTEEAFREAARKVVAAKSPTEKESCVDTRQKVHEKLRLQRGLLDKGEIEAAEAEQRLREMQELLLDQEAFYARTQILLFLRSRWCKLSPLSLANAIAGLPLIGWRHSLRRCSRLPCEVTSSLNYKIFEVVRQALEDGSPRSPEETVQLLRDSIPVLPKEFASVQECLTQNWSDFEASIMKTWKSSEPPGSRPFRITAAYHGALYEPKTALERLLSKVK